MNTFTCLNCGKEIDKDSTSCIYCLEKIDPSKIDKSEKIDFNEEKPEENATKIQEKRNNASVSNSHTRKTISDEYDICKSLEILSTITITVFFIFGAILLINAIYTNSQVDNPKLLLYGFIEFGYSVLLGSISYCTLRWRALMLKTNSEIARKLK